MKIESEVEIRNSFLHLINTSAVRVETIHFLTCSMLHSMCVCVCVYRQWIFSGIKFLSTIAPLTTDAIRKLHLFII